MILALLLPLFPLFKKKGPQRKSMLLFRNKTLLHLTSVLINHHQEAELHDFAT